MMTKATALLGTVLLVRLAWGANAADLTLKVTEKEPPKEAGEGIRKTLDAKAIQLMDGDKPVYQFWFRKDIPLKSPPESSSKALQSLDEVTLLGVATVGEGRRDYKDNEIAPGTYTIRFSLQPQDGDHLGTSEFLTFAVLIPAKSDTDLTTIKTYKAMVKASGKGTATSHPAILSLRPPSAEGGTTPALTTPAPDHKAIKLALPADASGQKATLNFELVYEGKFKS